MDEYVDIGDVQTQWPLRTVEDVKANGKGALISGPFGSNISAKYFTATGVPVIRGNNLSLDVGVKFKDADFAFITPDKAQELGTWAERGDLLFTAVGTIGQVGYLTGQDEYPRYIISNKQIRLRLDTDKLLPLFAYYWFASPQVVELIQQRNTGSSVPLINLGVVRSLPVPVPDMRLQKAVVEVLSSLDAKIDLLHRQNKTLEALAEALFRQWFVEEAEEGWVQRPLSSIATYLNGVACQKYPAKDAVNRLPVLKIKELSTGITDSSDWATSEIAPKYHVVAGDVVFSWSATLMVKLWDGPKAVLNQHLFKVTSDEFPKWFYFMWTKHYVEEFVAIATSHATTFGHIKRGDLDEAMVHVPGPERLKEMTAVMEPLFEKHITNSAQIKSLTALRDTLLPKLMSGEVRVEI